MNDNAPYLAHFLDVLMFQLFETAFILTLASYFGILIHMLVVMLGFSVGRFRYKGRHSKTKMGCLIYSTVSFMALAYISSITHIVIGLITGLIFGYLMRKTK